MLLGIIDHDGAACNLIRFLNHLLQLCQQDVEDLLCRLPRG